MSIILQAAKIATVAHKGQLRDNKRPYITHPARVAGQALAHPIAIEEWGAIAYLHDVLEDSSMTEGFLRQMFSGIVVNAVVELTNQYVDKSEIRAARKAKERERLGTISRVAKIIKMLDREDNLLEMPTPCSFRDLYVRESRLLLPLLEDADADLAARLGLVITSLEQVQ
jgi:(p)ppGpp synthase/HD superfamily hydrolase